MTNKTTVELLAVVCLVGAGLWLAEREGRESVAEVQTGKRLAPWDAAAVVGLKVDTPGVNVELVKQDDQWFLESPVRARADAGQIDRLLGGLEALSREEVVTPEQRAQRGLELADYGLKEPAARWLVNDGLQRYELQVGAAAPLGKLVYVKFADAPDVVATSLDLRGLAPTSVDALRDARIVSGAPERVSRVELHRAGQGFVRLVRQDGRWLLSQPVSGRADARLVQHLLDQLFALRAASFVWDSGLPGLTNGPGTGIAALPASPEADARDERYGLAVDEAAARIQVWLDNDLAGYELLVGKPSEAADGTVYARRRNIDSVYTIQPTQLEWLAVSVDELRERDVYNLAPGAVTSIRLRRGEQKVELARDEAGFWNLTDPVQWKADQQAVEDMLQRVTKWRALDFAEGAVTNVVADGARAFCVLRLSTASNAPGRAAAMLSAAPERDWSGDGDPLWIGVVTNPSPSVYARFESEPIVRRLAPTALQAFGEDPLDPLAYRDRTMLAVPPGEIQRIVLDFPGVATQTLVRAGSSAWLATGSSNAVASEVVEDVLFFASNLRALRVEALNPVSLVPYGLDGGGTVLTLGLQGETGIQKSIVFGGPARSDGVYAMVKGQDIVYALSVAVTDMLTRSLLVP
ncbi:MAG: DUF4340 domain-containing protein [Lentisphaerae bacterium]|nr:DUF4340 domain-containing protein [Lentisphaerota bacterium]